MLIEIDTPGRASLPEAPCALPAGTRLAEFELLSVLGEGGFGIVYLAFDHSLQREVAIKEYLPQALARRGAGQQVQLRSPEHDDDFALGLKSFVNEARTLAQFDHPALLKVYRFWQGNGTAYMATPVYRGQTLQAHRLALGRAPHDAEVRAVMLPLLQALQVLHEAEVLHGDVAPDNILIDALGQPVLLDFGAARQVLQAQGSAEGAAMLKPAYAAPERQGLAATQGPWSDLYSLGASLYFMLMGTAPPRAAVRLLQDSLEPLPTRALRDCEPALLREIDRLLALHPQARPGSAQEVWARVRQPIGALARGAPLAAAQPEHSQDMLPTQGWDTTEVQAVSPLPAGRVRAGRRGRKAWLLAAALAAFPLVLWLGRSADNASASAQTAEASASPSAVPASAAVPAKGMSAAAAMAAAVAASPATVAPSTAAAPARPRLAPPPASAPARATAGGTAAAMPAAPVAVPPAASPALPAAHPAAPTPAQTAAPAPSSPASPRAACAGEAFLFREVCIERQCGKSEWREHAQCVELRELQEASRRNREGG